MKGNTRGQGCYRKEVCPCNPNSNNVLRRPWLLPPLTNLGRDLFFTPHIDTIPASLGLRCISTQTKMEEPTLKKWMNPPKMTRYNE
jgi:hypothetical protein